jgi:hypothetical protein
MAERENGENLTPVDNWKLGDADYLNDMGFKADGQFRYSLKRPHMSVFHKKNEGFTLEDESKKTKHTFQTFNDLIEHFEKYEQKFERTPYL